MRKILILIISIFVLSNCFGEKSEKIELFPIVDNLKLRDEPGLESDTIRLLLKGEKLILLETGSEDIIDDKKGNWVKVLTKNNEEGWCFNACLNNKPIENIKSKEDDLKSNDKVNLINFIEKPFVKYGKPSDFDYNLDLIKIEYGEPKEIKTREIRNRHNDSLDKIIIIDYGSFYIEYYHVTLSDKYILVNIVISNNEIELRYGIRIGMTMDEIKNVFGKPDWIYEYEDGSIQYNYNTDDFKGVSVIFNENKKSTMILVGNPLN